MKLIFIFLLTLANISLYGKDITEAFGGGTGIRFQIRNVSINGETDNATLPRGGKVEIELEVLHNCPECGGALNQIIVGIAGENKAQACIWQGMNYSSGIASSCYTDKGQAYSGCSLNQKPAVWEKKRFFLHIPNKAGIYSIRARYSQAYGCHLGALGWWKVDRPNGPEDSSTIATVTVEKRSWYLF